MKKEYGYRGGQALVVYDSTLAGNAQMKWLVTDHLGSMRMEADKSGSLGGMRRHDYAPFGQEMYAGFRRDGGGQGQYGYEPPQSNVRMRFGSKERDNETGLDFFQARYFASVQGRFTSTDEFTGGPDALFTFVVDAAINPTFYADIASPQSLNKYQYCYNNPLAYVDPDGHQRRRSNQNLPTNKTPTVTVTKTTYPVRGNTAAEAISDARANNPHPSKRIGRTDANTIASPRDVETTVTSNRGGGFTAALTYVTVDVTTDITVSTPRWEGYDNAPASEQQAWDTMNNALVDHENGHVRIATEGATEIQQAVTGATGTATGRTRQQARTDASRNANADFQSRTTQAIERSQQRHNQYDRDTDHGRRRQE